MSSGQWSAVSDQRTHDSHDNGGLTTTQFGMLAFLLSEVAFFSTLIVTYIAVVGRDRIGPTPSQALSLDLVKWTTIILLASSVTVHLALGALAKDRRVMFLAFWTLTILLGAAFLAGTMWEWRDLIERHQLTIGRNLFGSAFYTVVGFHGLHVTAGVVVMTIVLALALANRITSANHVGPEMVGWYWHFVDVVWIAVFTVVYVVCR